MSDDGIDYAFYRCETSTQTGSKDWAIGLSAQQEVVIRFGATGQTARRVVVPRAHFKAADAAAELERRIQAQLDQGYEYLGQAIVKRGRLQGIPDPLEPLDGDPESTEAAPAPRLYRLHWAFVQPIERAAFCRELAWVAERLSEPDSPGAIEYDAKQSVCRVRQLRPWELGYSDIGGIASDNRGGGVIELEHGVLPVVVLAHLRKRFPGCVDLATQNGQVITVQFTAEDPIFEAHGLDPAKVKRLAGLIGFYPAWMPLAHPGDAQSPPGTWL
jgi:hypothetical protein